MTGKLLVAIDGSEQSHTVLEYSAKLVKAMKLDVLVLNVIDTGLIGAHHWIAIKDKLEEELEVESKKIVTSGKEYMRSQGINVEATIRRGHPYEEIILAADAHEDIEAVVMGAYGKGFFERKVVGSKTEKVLREISKLSIPLIIVPIAGSRKLIK
jgi:nucleotide-binding universal stress UspA family protein